MTITQTESGKTTVILFSQSALFFIKYLLDNGDRRRIIEKFIVGFGIINANMIVTVLLYRHKIQTAKEFMLHNTVVLS